MQNAEKNEEEKTAPGGQDGERAHGQDDGERRDGQTKGGAMKIRVTHGQDGERRGGQYVMRRDEDQSTVYSDTAHEFETHNQQIPISTAQSTVLYSDKAWVERKQSAI